jgi:hypothetical protein
MRLRGKLTAEEIRDAGNLLRPKTYWPKLLLKNWYGLALLGVLAWATIAPLLDPGPRGYLRPLGIIWLVVGAIFVWAYTSTMRTRKRNYAAINLRSPDWVTLEGHGVRFDHLSGETSFYPWDLYKGWREGEKVVLLDMRAERGSQILPIGDLPVSEKSRLVDISQTSVKAPIR